MTLLRVYERQFDQNDKPIIIQKKDQVGTTIPTSATKTYYMDLSREEENILRDTKRFSFETIRDFELTDISPKDIEIGSERKTIVVEYWAKPENKRA